MQAYLASFLKLAEHPWFTRIWTVQEFVFARRCVLLSGTKVLKWAPLEFCLGFLSEFTDTLISGESDNPKHQLAINRLRFRRQARSLANYKGQYTKPALSTAWRNKSTITWIEYQYAILKMIRNRDWHGWELKRLMFLSSVRDLDSGLPHDKIYGVYSILEAMGIGLPEPDYSKPVQEVAQSLTRALVTSTESLDSITLDLPPSGDSRTPSWVPDYLTPMGNKREALILPILRLNWRVSDPNASNGSKAHAICEANTGKLLVQGKRVVNLTRTIASNTSMMGQKPWDHESFREFIKACREWCFAFKSSQNFRRSHMLRWADLMSYPNCDMIEPEAVAKYSDPSENDPITIILNYLNKSEKDANDEFGETVRGIQLGLNMTASWAFLFIDTEITDQSITGRGYHTCEKGDQLWLLAGSRVPVVLRRTEENNEFRYISSAIFDGIMKGEHWPEDGKEGLEMIYLV